MAGDFNSALMEIDLKAVFYASTVRACFRLSKTPEHRKLLWTKVRLNYDSLLKTIEIGKEQVSESIRQDDSLNNSIQGRTVPSRPKARDRDLLHPAISLESSKASTAAITPNGKPKTHHESLSITSTPVAGHNTRKTLRHDKDESSELHLTVNDFKTHFASILSSQIDTAAKDGFFKRILTDIGHPEPPSSNRRSGKNLDTGRLFSANGIEHGVVALSQHTKTFYPCQGESDLSLDPRELLRKFMTLLKDDDVCSVYRADIDIQVKGRSNLGLPGHKSPLDHLEGCRLHETIQKVPGIHTPFAYESDGKFGAIFPLHVEDFELCSINVLYKGRKIWLLIPMSEKERLEDRCRASKMIKSPSPCAQFMRHNPTFISADTLDSWNIKYRLIAQDEGEVLVTLPGVYHQGFSVGYTLAEAINYAHKRWAPHQYNACNVERCGPSSITLTHLGLHAKEPKTSMVVKRPRPVSTGRSPGKPRKGAKVSREISESTRFYTDRRGDSQLQQFRNSMPTTMKGEKLDTVSKLFSYVASGQAVRYLKPLCTAARKVSGKSKVPSNIGEIMEAISRIENDVALQTFRRRYLFHVLHRRREAFELCSRRSKRGTTRTGNARHDSVAIDMMLEETGSTSDVSRRSLQNRLHQGRVWHRLCQDLFPGILLLMPSVGMSLLEKLEALEIDVLVSGLKKWKDGLSSFTDLLEPMMKLALGEPTRCKFMLEDESDDAIEAEAYGSTKLLDFCRIKESV